MRYASRLGMLLMGSAAGMTLSLALLAHLKPISRQGPGTRRSTYRGRTTRFNQHCGRRQRERYARQNAMQRQLDSHKGEHTVKPFHIFGTGREAA